MRSKKKFLAKIVVSGDGGVGKTTLIHRLMTGDFRKDTKLTIGSSFHSYTREIENIQTVSQIWDLGGQPRFKSLNIFDTYLKGATASIIAFDMSRVQTLAGIREWTDLTLRNSDALLFLIGTKADLITPENDFSDLVDQVRSRFNYIEFYKTSSRTGKNVEMLFDDVLKHLVRRAKEEEEEK